MCTVIKIAFSGIEFDVVTCIPLSKKSFNSRGYNQSELLARAIATDFKIPFTPLLKKVKDNNAQHTLPRENRKYNVLNVYESIETAKKYKNILLIDDIITTGSTLNECVKLLQSRFDANIFCATYANV